MQPLVAPPPPGASPRSSRRATIEEWLAIPEERRAELINGRIVYQGMPGPVHGRAQLGMGSLVRGPYDRRPGGADRPGGWWISMEVDLEIADMGCRPDVLGWRRDKHASMPAPSARGVVTAAPDWICEVLSRTTAHIDLGEKRVAYHRAEVAHYWLLDTHNETLTVLRWTPDGYLVELVAGRGEKVRAPPFEAAEVEVSELIDDVETEGGATEASSGEDAP